MPKMLLAAGPTMFVRVTALLISVAVTAVTPLAAGHPGASAAPAVGPRAPEAVFDPAPAAPPVAAAPVAAAPPAAAPGPVAPVAPGAPPPVGDSLPVPPPAAARLVDVALD